MEKFLAVSLKKQVLLKAKEYSDPQRPLYSGQTFSLHKIISLSGDSAASIFQLSGGKKSIRFWYWIRTGKNKKNPLTDKWEPQGAWFGFFPTDGHILGMMQFAEIKNAVEKHNFEFNFNEKEKK